MSRHSFRLADLARAVKVVRAAGLPVNGEVYAIARTAGGYRFKIGHSNNPRRRCSDLQMATPDRLELFARVTVSDAPRVERSIHKAMAPLRVSGEWFECKPNLLQEIFETIGRDGKLDEFVFLCIECAVASRDYRCTEECRNQSRALWEKLKALDTARACRYDVMRARIDAAPWKRSA